MNTGLVRFALYECTVAYSVYGNGRPEIRLYDAEDGLPFLTATLNVPEAELADGETLIKDYNENKGLLAALVNAGIVERTGKVLPVGHAVAHVVRVPQRRAVTR